MASLGMGASSMTTANPPGPPASLFRSTHTLTANHHHHHHLLLVFLLVLPMLLASACGHKNVITSGMAGEGADKMNMLKLNLMIIRDSFEQKTAALSNSSATTGCLFQRSRQSKGGRAIILELVHRDHCSGHKTTSWADKAETTLASDDARVQSLQSRLRSPARYKTDDVPQVPLSSGIKLQTLNYIASVELGGRKMSVIVDTGSDLTWVQCQPCRLCYTQQDPLFNPSISPSYSAVTCNSSTCQSLLIETGNSRACSVMGPPQMCSYTVRYGDGSYTRGELGLETLKLGPTTSVSNFVFGCGRNNKGLFGGTSGLMGLGRSSLSLVSQTSAQFGGVFSYCLPTAEAASPGSLAFGGDPLVYKNTTPISYTSIIPNPQLPTFYFLNLTGISVGGAALDSPSFGNAGILIDSGTVITRLPPSIYKALKGEFVRQFSGFPSAPGFSILDTCFNLSSYREVDIPKINMQFGAGNGELEVDVMGIFYFAKADASQVCLALASLTYEDDTGIIGNYQQKNQRIIYDTKGNKLGFAKETCSFV